jgi:dynein heavy chain
MSRLEMIVDTLETSIHPEFRLWMTSMPTPKFPVSALQNSVKMTMEPPSALRSNLLQTYENIEDSDLESCRKPHAYKKLLFGLSFFHAIVQARRKFGGIGWNIPYAFTLEDFDVCKKQLKIFLNDYDEVPYKVLTFLVAEINYGGRVTDYIDGILIFSLINRYLKPEIMDDDFYFSKTKVYRSIPAGS